VFYTALLAWFRPYEDPYDDTLAISNQLMLFLTLQGA
jgi:hypothetical protein